MQFISTPLPLDIQRKLDQIGDINRKKAATWEDAIDKVCAHFSCQYREIEKCEEKKAKFTKILLASGHFTKDEVWEAMK